ncbi:CDGSH iron-sulfur domain-containing protein [Streptomyces sp. NPDC054835]|uniref:CDGSH iron-sulfur domain-containing protein n=2 Tax=Streptomyces TaxID=1883 RepID=UPI003819525C
MHQAEERYTEKPDEGMPDEGMPDGERQRAAARITPLAEGPLLVEGPVEIVLPDGTIRRSDRPVVALCRCRRSLREPFCDTSHRHRSRRASTRTEGSR